MTLHNRQTPTTLRNQQTFAIVVVACQPLPMLLVYAVSSVFLLLLLQL